MHRAHPTSILVVSCLCLFACSDDSGQRTVGGDDVAATDGVGGDDVLFPGDTGGGGGDATGATPDGTAGNETSDTSVTPDGEGPCNTFGCPCSSNADCLDELCVEGIDGRVCSRPCVTECPDSGFACVPITLGGDPFNACVPQHPHLCKPCRADSECKNELQPSSTALCLPAPDPKDGSFCASSCANGPCPDGFTCSDVALDGGGTAKQCVPTDGSCECRPSWAAMNLATDCQRENAVGTCGGERTCGLDGLTACDALPATAETCNGTDDDCNGVSDDIAEVACTQEDNGVGACPGVTRCEGGAEICDGVAASNETCNLVDDDCDGETDDGTCGDGLACTDDVCAGVGACDNPIQAGQCVIDGRCVAENEANPDFPCQRCVPAVSQTSWTGDGEGPSCYINGECWPEGAGKPDEPCLRCRPEVSTTTWSPAAAGDVIACDDGNACTKEDTCNGGACLGTAYTCDDGKQCTDNVCDGAGGCEHPVVAGACLIEGACYETGARADATTCRVCDAAANQVAWSAPATALSCDDGEACTSGDVCAGATCAGSAYDCDDMTACTVDSCDGQGGCINTAAEDFCVIDGECYADSATDPANGCQACKVATSISAWTPYAAAEHVACDDDNTCTHTDECTAGQCLGTPYACGDGEPCTKDVCDGAGGCDYPVIEGNCYIGGECYTDGERENATGCNVCDDATPTAWSAATTALSCDDGNLCSNNDVCAGANCGGASYSCDDGATCTADSCDGVGGCDNELQAGSCFIGGVCYNQGQANPQNPCLVCDTAISPLFWSSKPNGAACNDGNACTYGDQCSFGSCLAIPYDCIGQGCCVGDGTCTNTPPVGVIEQCANGIDDDCDGVTDEGQPEVCGNNIDDDCDEQTDESANTWGEVFFARGWRENVTTPTVAIYTSNFDGTFQMPKVIDFPTEAARGIAGVGDFDADRFLDLVVVGWVYGDDHDACLTDADCPDERCVGGGCVPVNCKVVGCASASGTECIDSAEHFNDYTYAGRTNYHDYCSPPTRYYVARETCPEGAVELLEVFTLPPGDFVTAILDVDGDGHLDFVVRKHWSTRRGYVMLNGGDPGNIQFSKIEYRADGTTPMLPMPTNPQLPFGAPCRWAYGISRTSKDLNGDGIVDLVGTCIDSGDDISKPKLWWWQGRGDGSFEPYQQFFDLTGKGTSQFGLFTMNDFNRDGFQDAVGGLDDDGDAGSIWPVLHRSHAIDDWLAGSKAFDVMPTISSGAGNPGSGGGTSQDFDRDGYADLLVAWAPDVPACHPVEAASCVYSDLAVLTNVTSHPCGPGMQCNAASQCEACSSVCPRGAECGTNGCGGTCGSGCEANEICQGYTCVSREACVADCAGKACGDNGCGGVCGICPDGERCNTSGQCVATSSCGTCTNKACGTDDCGMPCVFFKQTYTMPRDTNPRGAEAPTNVPPTRPEIRIQPENPADSQDLICTVSVPSYDLDPVQYQYRWYRRVSQGAPTVFMGEVSNRPVVPASMTTPGHRWHCEVTATDRLEYSPRAVSATVTIQGGIIAVPTE